MNLHAYRYHYQYSRSSQTERNLKNEQWPIRLKIIFRVIFIKKVFKVCLLVTGCVLVCAWVAGRGGGGD